MTSAIHNRQAGAGKVITFITHSVLVNTAGTASVTLDMEANCSVHGKSQIVLKVCLNKGVVDDTADGWTTPLFHLTYCSTGLSQRMTRMDKYDEH